MTSVVGIILWTKIELRIKRLKPDTQKQTIDQENNTWSYWGSSPAIDLIYEKVEIARPKYTNRPFKRIDWIRRAIVNNRDVFMA